MNKSPKSAEIIRPILRGTDIKMYSCSFSNLWLINSHNGIRDLGIQPIMLEKDYNSVFQYLKRFESALEKRLDKGDHWSNLRNCAYFLEFEKEKIVWQELSRTGSSFCYLKEPMYLTNTAYALTGLDTRYLKYLTGVLNNPISVFYLEQVYNKLDRNGWRWLRSAVEQIPVPKIETHVIERLSSYVDEIQTIKQQKGDIESLIIEFNRMIYQLYNLTPTEINHIEVRLNSSLRNSKSR